MSKMLVIAAPLRIDGDEDDDEDEPLLEVEEYWILSRVMIVGSFIKKVVFWLDTKATNPPVQSLQAKK